MIKEKMILFFKGYIYIPIHKQDIRNLQNRKQTLSHHRLGDTWESSVAYLGEKIPHFNATTWHAVE